MSPLNLDLCCLQMQIFSFLVLQVIELLHEFLNTVNLDQTAPALPEAI